MSVISWQKIGHVMKKISCYNWTVVIGLINPNLPYKCPNFQPVGDGEDSSPSERLSDSVLDDRVRLYVYGCSCLVHYNDLVIGEEGSSQTNQLSLSNTANTKRAYSYFPSVISRFHPHLTFRQFATVNKFNRNFLVKFTVPQ